MQPQKTLPSIQSPTSQKSSLAPLAGANLEVLTGTEPLKLLGELDRWRVMEPPPGTADELSTVSAGLVRGLAPASPNQYQQAESDLVRWMKGFGMQTAAPEVVLETYRLTLTHLPADLIAKAVERIITTWKWGQRPPLPADILATIADDLAKRRRLMLLAQLAQTKARRLARTASRGSCPNPSSDFPASRPFVARPKRMPKDEPEETAEQLEIRKKRMIIEYGLG